VKGDTDRIAASYNVPEARLFPKLLHEEVERTRHEERNPAGGAATREDNHVVGRIGQHFSRRLCD
jgi:hypothetical protein